MLTTVTSPDFTKLSLFEVSGGVHKVEDPGLTGLTTRKLPIALVGNLMQLHESAAPGVVKGFTTSLRAHDPKVFDKLVEDSIRSRESISSPRRRIDAGNPEEIMKALYSATFLQNNESRECLVYSKDGNVVAMAHVGEFSKDFPALSCTMSNLVLSPKIDAETQSQVIQHASGIAKEYFGEASLLTSEDWSQGYRSRGFLVEHLEGEVPSSPSGTKLVRCRL